MKQFEDAIRRHLEELAEKDELFRAVFAKEGKSIAECCRYILSEARKRGVAVAMSDEEVYGLAVHYYDEDDLRVPSVAAVPRIATPEAKLSKKEKEEIAEQARLNYENECRLKLKQAEARRKAKRIERAREATAGMADLFA